MIVVPYIGTWIETIHFYLFRVRASVVPYIGTWIETLISSAWNFATMSYLI